MQRVSRIIQANHQNRFAFVEFKDEECAKRALEEMNETEVCGRKVIISVSPFSSVSRSLNVILSFSMPMTRSKQDNHSEVMAMVTERVVVEEGTKDLLTRRENTVMEIVKSHQTTEVAKTTTEAIKGEVEMTSLDSMIMLKDTVANKTGSLETTTETSSKLF